jgi:hypothetical protein
MALLKSLVGISDGAERLKFFVSPCGFAAGEKSLLKTINGSPAQSGGRVNAWIALYRASSSWRLFAQHYRFHRDVSYAMSQRAANSAGQMV